MAKKFIFRIIEEYAKAKWNTGLDEFNIGLAVGKELNRFITASKSQNIEIKVEFEGANGYASSFLRGICSEVKESDMFNKLMIISCEDEPMLIFELRQTYKHVEADKKSKSLYESLWSKFDDELMSALMNLINANETLRDIADKYQDKFGIDFAMSCSIEQLQNLTAKLRQIDGSLDITRTRYSEFTLEEIEDLEIKNNY